MLAHTALWRRLLAFSAVTTALSAGWWFQDVHSQITPSLQPGQFKAHDPGVRTGPSGAGGPVSGLSAQEQRVFANARTVFQEVQSVQGSVPGTEAGLGPRFNLDSCAGCHAFPDLGGSSPAVNPQIEVAKKLGATNDIPSFITRDGPIREARFKFNAD
ncbi:MAG TPA: hypothetical protein VFS39_18765, partial [Nitrospira sp.]|nr:hypothetical protein [Nitrospira sp.]